SAHDRTTTRRIHLTGPTPNGFALTPFDPAFQRDPYAVLHRVRAAASTEAALDVCFRAIPVFRRIAEYWIRRCV
ncbi:MAG: hypothetical protein NT024_01640, partial [Proteobacteria bacterium]|nr:hypothetical protein [Pseudomonadota bacterium]